MRLTLSVFSLFLAASSVQAAEPLTLLRVVKPALLGSSTSSLLEKEFRLSPKGNWIALATSPTRVTIFDLEKEVIVQTIKSTGKDQVIREVVISPDQTKAAVIENPTFGPKGQSLVRILDIASGKALNQYAFGTALEDGVSYAVSGINAAFALDSASVVLAATYSVPETSRTDFTRNLSYYWNFSKRANPALINSEKTLEAVNSAGFIFRGSPFSRDGGKYVTQYTAWTPGKGETASITLPIAQNPWDVGSLFGPDKNFVFGRATFDEHAIYSIDWKSKLVETVYHYNQKVNGVQVPQMYAVASAAPIALAYNVITANYSLIELETGAISPSVQLPKEWQSRVGFQLHGIDLSPNGKLAVFNYEVPSTRATPRQGYLAVFDLESGQLFGSTKLPYQDISGHTEFSADGQYLVSSIQAAADHKISIFKLNR